MAEVVSERVMITYNVRVMKIRGGAGGGGEGVGGGGVTGSRVKVD